MMLMGGRVKTAIYTMFLAVMAISAFSATIHVPADQPTIQAGINVAIEGDTVLVADGVYTGEGNRDIVVGIGGIIIRSQNGPEFCIVDCEGSETTPHRGFIYDNAEGHIQGLAVRNAYVSGSGAGIASFMESGLQLKRCLFEGNTATEIGGAVYCQGGFLVADSCRFLFNTASFGGAVALDSGAISFPIYRSLFLGNIALQGGGAAYSGTGWSDLNIVNSTIVDNSALSSDHGGAAIYCLDSISGYSLENCIVAYNGPGVAVSKPSGSGYGRVMCTNFLDNLDGNFSEGSDTSGFLDNISVPPLFCDTANGDYSLHIASPCSVDSSSCGQMGVFGIGCDGDILLSLSIDCQPDMMHNTEHVAIFVWQYDQSFGFNQSSFEIAVGTDDDWEYAEMWNPAPFDSPDTSIVYGGASLIDGETYYLRLRLSNGSFWTAWYNTSFRMNSVPSVPIPLQPINETIVGNNPTLWVENSIDPEGDTLTYDFLVIVDTLYGEPDPQDGNNIAETPDSTGWQVPESLMDNDRYWWRARAYDGYEYSDWTDLFASAFFVNGTPEAPTAPTPIIPPDTSGLPVFDMLPTFTWGGSFDPDPFDSVLYRLEIALDSDFAFVNITDSINSTEHTIDAPLDFNTQYWGRVSAFDVTVLTTISEYNKDFWTWTLGDLNHDHSVDIVDLVYLVNYMFNGGQAPFPLSVADINGDCIGPDIAGLVYLVNYMFNGGPAPVPCP